MNEQPNELSNGPSENSPQALFVTLILDESGSMQSCKRAAIAGFNQYVKSLKDEPAATWFTLTVFNSRRTEVRYRGVPVATVPELDIETYRPQDTTPLYDAIGQTLAAAQAGGAGRLQEALRHPDRRPGEFLEGIHPEADLRAHQELRKEGWRFVYLGADHDVWAAGEDLGIAVESRVAFSKERHRANVQ